MFDPRGYQVEHWHSKPPYDFWRKHMTEDELHHFQARYAASVVFCDKWLGKLLDKMDELDLWKDTVVIFTSDHGTFNGDHGRIGKTQTHLFDAVGHIPFLLVHPEYGAGERRDQLVQLVDIYPTVLSALNRPCPSNRHGVSLLPVVQDRSVKTRTYAISGQFGKSVSITDGHWILHQSPRSENKPLYWYGHQTARFDPLGYKLAEYRDSRHAVVDYPAWPEATWLSNRDEDLAELQNIAGQHPDQVERLTMALRDRLLEVGAPQEQMQRLNL
jgi:arylsulfatase A-like enzyme